MELARFEYSILDRRVPGPSRGFECLPDGGGRDGRFFPRVDVDFELLALASGNDGNGQCFRVTTGANCTFSEGPFAPK